VTTVLALEDIKPLIHAPELITEMEAGFVLYSEGRVTVPPVGFLHFDDPPGDVHIKYGFVAEDEYYVLKMASGFYENGKLGLPDSNGLLLVFNQKTGAPELILIDECWLTDMRTAAAGAVAAKHLGPSAAQQIGIVGTGVQARMQLEMLSEVTDCRKCVMWGRDAEKVEAMIDELRGKESIRDWGLEIESAPTLDDLVTSSDLIVTTTSARDPLIRADLVQPGTHITAMGSDDRGKQELEAEVLARADVVVADSVAQCVDHGECHFAVRDGILGEDAIRELGQVLLDPALGRTRDDQITVADLTGVAIQDIQAAKMVARALKNQTAERTSS
jgi:ornithine cyclodeaminase